MMQILSIAFLIPLFLSSLVAAVPTLQYRADGNVSNPIPNPVVARFEDLVGDRLKQLANTWGPIEPWMIEAKTPDGGPQIRAQSFKKLEIKVFNPHRQMVLTTENMVANDPTHWTPALPSRPASVREIQTWTWNEPRRTFIEAFQILGDHFQAPILTVLLFQFHNGPQWGRHDQQYYMFSPDNSPKNTWAVGAENGRVYPPPTLGSNTPAGVSLGPANQTDTGSNTGAEIVASS